MELYQCRETQIIRDVDDVDHEFPNVVRCAIWYHLYNLKNMKNIYRGVLILVKLQAKVYKN